MPLHWKISPLEHIVVCIFEGAVTAADIVGYFRALEAAGAQHYRRILDATRGECTLSEVEVAKLAAQAKSFGASGTPAPVAVVTGSTHNDTIVSNLRKLTPANRRMRAFLNIHEARRWLSREPEGSARRR